MYEFIVALFFEIRLFDVELLHMEFNGPNAKFTEEALL